MLMPVIAIQVHFLRGEVLIQSIRAADLIRRPLVLTQRMMLVFGMRIHLQVHTVPKQLHTEHVIDAAEAVITIDKEPKPPAFS